MDELLFNLIILKSIVNSDGLVWQTQPTQYYIVECMPLLRKVKHDLFVDGRYSNSVILSLVLTFYSVLSYYL